MTHFGTGGELRLVRRLPTVLASAKFDDEVDAAGVEVAGGIDVSE